MNPAHQHDRNFFDHFKPVSVRSFDKLRTGSELIEGLRESYSATCLGNLNGHYLPIPKISL